MLMIRPLLRGFISRRAARVQRNGPRRLVLMTRSQASTLSSIERPAVERPGIVHQQIEPAEFAADAGKELLHLLLVSHVRGMHDRPSPR